MHSTLRKEWNSPIFQYTNEVDCQILLLGKFLFPDKLSKENLFQTMSFLTYGMTRHIGLFVSITEQRRNEWDKSRVCRSLQVWLLQFLIYSSVNSMNHSFPFARATTILYTGRHRPKAAKTRIIYKTFVVRFSTTKKHQQDSDNPNSILEHNFMRNRIPLNENECTLLRDSSTKGSWGDTGLLNCYDA